MRGERNLGVSRRKLGRRRGGKGSENEGHICWEKREVGCYSGALRLRRRKTEQTFRTGRKKRKASSFGQGGLQSVHQCQNWGGKGAAEKVIGLPWSLGAGGGLKKLPTSSEPRKKAHGHLQKCPVKQEVTHHDCTKGG